MFYSLVWDAVSGFTNPTSCMLFFLVPQNPKPYSVNLNLWLIVPQELPRSTEGEGPIFCLSEQLLLLRHN